MICITGTVLGRNFTEVLFDFLEIVEVPDENASTEPGEFLFLFQENPEEYHESKNNVRCISEGAGSN